MSAHSAGTGQRAHPWAYALGELNVETVTLPPDPPEHTSRLMATLGVRVETDARIERPKHWRWADRGRDGRLGSQA